QSLVKGGKLTVDQLMKVTQQMKVLGDEADQMPVTFGDAAQRMINKFTAFVGRINESTGGVGALTAAIDALGDNLATVTAAVGTLIALKLAGWLGLTTVGFTAATAA